ncbi:MAG: peptide chain release factor 2, partial [Planctomycetes bacterium]|nr:peptide chain release factor 2 [Planctomycetota bacterium]
EFAQVLDLRARRVAIQDHEVRMSDSSFWDDQEQAQKIITELKTMKGMVDPYDELTASVVACGELLEMAEADNDDESIDEIREELERLDAEYNRVELSLALSGPYDNNNVYLSLQPGAGGVEACDWAEMMLRMYTNYLTRNGYTCELIASLPGEEAGLKSCTLYVKGPMAYGRLKSEMGTHRLVRMSPFNAQGKRQTSFCAVEITPEIPDADVIDVELIDEKEFRIDTFRASGAGGQHINKTDSAVRITHIPSNVVVSCQSERSQSQNKNQAWKMMTGKLQQLAEAERLSELKDLMSDRGTIGWGHQIRSYVLQPTQLITDLRSRYKESNALGVLDGDLQPLIDSYLRWRLEQDNKQQQN